MSKLGRLFGGLSLITWMVCALASLVPHKAKAQQADTVVGVVVGVASASALAAGTRWYVRISNESATATISCNFGGTAVINSGGSFTLLPNTYKDWSDFAQQPNFRATISQQINCIASAASTPVTIEYH